MAVQVSTQHVPSLMIAALAGAGALFVFIVVLNNVSGKASVKV